MSERIYLSPAHISSVEEDALVRAFRSGWIAPEGPDVESFEAELAAYCHRRHCVALSSGTAALHLGLLTMGVGPGDTVVTASMTSPATANAIAHAGAEPVFIDSDETGNMSATLLASALGDLALEGARVKAVLPVDLLGKVSDHERIDAVAAAHGVPVLSDAAESLGAFRGGRPSASFGLAAVLSFNVNQIATAAGGGALLTDDAQMANRVRYLATQARQPTVHYEHTEIGYNYRLSNLLAAIGRAQLSRLEDMVERRRLIREHYRQFFAGVPGVALLGDPAEASTCDPRPGTRDNCWLTSLVIDPDAAGFTAEELRLALDEHGVEAKLLWKPLHAQPAFAAARAYLDGTSERLFRRGLSLPSGSGLSEAEIRRIDRTVEEFLRGVQLKQKGRDHGVH